MWHFSFIRFCLVRRSSWIAVVAVTVIATLAPGRSGVGDDSASPTVTAVESAAVEVDSQAYAEYIAERPFNVGYERQRFEYPGLDGETVTRQLDLWYPTEEVEEEWLYLYQWGRAAVDAEVAEGKHPLLIFSHGFMGSSDQSIFVMEACARAGYIVAAVNHHDAILNRREGERALAPRSIDRDDWNDMTYADRRHDVVTLLDTLLAWNETPDHRFAGRIDPSAIGAIGHSLGGYTLLGMAGAWESWTEPRIGALVVYSPYVRPYRDNGEVENIEIPVMLQGATFDLTITPLLSPLYRRLNCPRHYLVLKGGTHLDWTNFVSIPSTTVECLEEENPRVIVDYTIAFFDHFLLGQDRREILDSDDPRLYDWAAHLEPGSD